MRKIAIAAAVSLSLSGVTGVTHALGLGEIEMYSALNQSLDAEIAILSATEDELRDMKVGLASAGAFARAGLQMSPVLASVGFTVDRRPDGKAVVKVTSDSPVLEPFLNFLLEVESPGSVKLVREYTVLLNPSTLAVSDSVEPVTVTPVNAPAITEALPLASTSEAAGNELGSSGNGVAIDLSGTTLSGFENNDIGSEVTFTETTVGMVSQSNTSESTTVASVDDAGPESLFIPDDQVINNTNSVSNSSGGNTVVDSNGQVISLTQEIVTTPQFNEPSVNSTSGNGNGQAIALDNLGSQSDSQVSVQENTDNAIFGNEFNTGAQLASGDTDAQSDAGNLIDLSGVFDESSAAGTDEGSTAFVVETGRNPGSIELSGDSYRISRQDTLWSISNAQKARGVTPHQMMVALLDANPEAFIGGNMNRMRTGAVLQIPSESGQRSVSARNALSIVESWTRDNRAPVRREARVEPAITVEDAETVVDNSSNLNAVTEQLETVQSEISSSTLQRDELQGRVESLTNNMEEMKGLITVRESELNQLQNEVAVAESNAAAIDAQISQLSNASAGAAQVQEGLSQELIEAQNAIAEKADADKNLATAEAEAQSILLSSEEDSLRAQLSALEVEKRDLEASSQLEKAALVRESEAEKTRLLAQAKAERENILAELEAEKARITSEAEIEIARIRGEAELENQRLLSEAQAERDKVAADKEQMEAKLAEMESDMLEKSETAEAVEAQTQMAATDSDEPSRVKDRLAQLKEEGNEVAGNVQENVASAVEQVAPENAVADTDAEGIVAGAAETMTDAGKTMTDAGGKLAAGGTAAVGGLLGFAPLQDVIGNRKTILAAGAGLSLLGLLGAWGLRRRKTPSAEVKGKGLRPRGEGRPVVSPAQPNYEQERAMYGDSDQSVQPQRRSSSSAAAAAAAAAAAVTGTAAVATTRSGNETNDAEKPLAPKSAAPETAAPVAAGEAARSPVEPAQPAPAVSGQTTSDAQASVDSELEEKALDDTITEAEVYLRYGLHGQAEDLLKTAIERSPNNEEYHFKLLENYHDQKNDDNFSGLAETFKAKFPNSGHQARIAEMAAELKTSTGSSGVGAGVAGTVAAGAAGAAAMATGAAANAKDAASDGIESLTGSADDLLDQTIDPGSEFSVDELQATGNLSAFADDSDFADQGGMALDEVDLAALDDDGTMNLEEIAGSQMSGGDLGTLDLTNPGFEPSLDDLTFEDADLSTPGDVTDSFDTASQNPVAGGTDEMETMLDLAKAYIDMGDNDNASKALKDIAARGNPLQQTEAAELLKKLS